MGHIISEFYSQVCEKTNDAKNNREFKSTKKKKLYFA